MDTILVPPIHKYGMSFQYTNTFPYFQPLLIFCYFMWCYVLSTSYLILLQKIPCTNSHLECPMSSIRMINLYSFCLTKLGMIVHFFETSISMLLKWGNAFYSNAEWCMCCVHIPLVSSTFFYFNFLNLFIIFLYFTYQP